MGKNDNLVIWIVVGILAYSLITSGGLPSLNKVGSVKANCDLSTASPDLDINAYDVENPATAVTDDQCLYRKKGGGGTWTDWTLGTEITDLEYGAEYEFFIPGDLAEANVKAEPFGKYMTFTGDCTPDTSMRIEVANDETYDGLSATFYNEDHNAAAQTFSANDKKRVELVWKAGSDEFYGHPYLNTYPMLSDNGAHRREFPNMLCLKLNSTAWDEPEGVFFGGQEMRRVSGGTVVSADSAATHISYCYESPVITDNRASIFVDMDAKAAAPTVDDTAYLYSGNIYWNSDTAEPGWGIEDNDGQYVGGNGDADELTLDFT